MLQKLGGGFVLRKLEVLNLQRPDLQRAPNGFLLRTEGEIFVALRRPALVQLLNLGCLRGQNSGLLVVVKALPMAKAWDGGLWTVRPRQPALLGGRCGNWDYARLEMVLANTPGRHRADGLSRVLCVQIIGAGVLDLSSIRNLVGASRMQLSLPVLPTLPTLSEGFSQ